jgi:hypothetical protein
MQLRSRTVRALSTRVHTRASMGGWVGARARVGQPPQQFLVVLHISFTQESCGTRSQLTITEESAPHLRYLVRS